MLGKLDKTIGVKLSTWGVVAITKEILSNH